MFSRTKTFIQVWNFLRVSKWWQNFIFWVNYPFKRNYWINYSINPNIEFSDVIIQFSLNSICAIKSTISLKIKCPQLSKPEATAARNQNSICDRTEKKPWEKPGSVGGASSPLARRTSSLFQLQQSQIVRTQLVPVVFSRWLSRWRGPHWGSISGAHLGVLVSADVQGCRGCLYRCWSTIWSGYGLDLVTAVTIRAGYGLDWVTTVTSE